MKIILAKQIFDFLPGSCTIKRKVESNISNKNIQMCGHVNFVVSKNDPYIISYEKKIEDYNLI